MKAGIQGVPWRGAQPPRKVLAIRLQALGDTVITLPYLLDLRRRHPRMTLHFLTRREVGAIPAAAGFFERVIQLGGGRSHRRQMLLVLLMLPWFWWQRYDAVIDLQNNRVTRLLRRLVRPRAWVEFDRYSPLSHGERARQTIEALWSWKNALDTGLELRHVRARARHLLQEHGWQRGHSLVVLNPAGYGGSRSWPLDSYCEFARHWRETRDPRAQFVLLLLPALRERARFIVERLGSSCIDLTGRADQVEAFSILRECSLVLTEDSGLSHMAWVQGVPTLALFSSSRKDWSAPQGQWSDCLDSSDLPCGPCNSPVCRFGDNRCLTRYTPAFVAARAGALIERLNAGVAGAR
jgi:heptosyltransferase-2